jgi:hypothetical protein
LTAQKMGASEEAPFITATRREDLRLGDLAAAGGDQRGHTQREQRRRGVRGNWHRHLHCSAVPNHIFFELGPAMEVLASAPEAVCVSLSNKYFFGMLFFLPL